MTPLRTLLPTLALLLALASTGCGGGGGGGGAPPADASLLSGDYAIWYLTAIEDTPDKGGTLWGTLTADGLGALTGASSQNNGGSVTGPNAITGTYTVAVDRETTLTFGVPAAYAGWTNAAGTMTATGAATSGLDPAAVVLIKRGSGFSTSSLSGGYHIAGMAIFGGSTISYFGSGTFDGSGNLSANLGVNNEGGITPPAGTSATYAVTPSGEVTLTFASSDTYTGTILPDGGLTLIGGSTTDTQAPAALAFVPMTTGATNATLSGTYQLIGIERDGGGYTSLTGSAVANGSGTLTVAFTRNTDGTISASGPDVVPYSVAGDGTLTIEPAGEMLVGGVSPTGDYAILGGPMGAASNPKFFVLMRR